MPNPKKITIAIDKIRSVARPDQLQTNNFMPLVVTNEVDYFGDFSIDDNDPIFHQSQPQQQPQQEYQEQQQEKNQQQQTQQRQEQQQEQQQQKERYERSGYSFSSFENSDAKNALPNIANENHACPSRKADTQADKSDNSHVLVSECISDRSGKDMEQSSLSAENNAADGADAARISPLARPAARPSFVARPSPAAPKKITGDENFNPQYSGKTKFLDSGSEKSLTNNGSKKTLRDSLQKSSRLANNSGEPRAERSAQHQTADCATVTAPVQPEHETPPAGITPDGITELNRTLDKTLSNNGHMDALSDRAERAAETIQMIPLTKKSLDPPHHQQHSKQQQTNHVGRVIAQPQVATASSSNASNNEAGTTGVDRPSRTAENATPTAVQIADNTASCNDIPSQPSSFYQTDGCRDPTQTAGGTIAATRPESNMFARGHLPANEYLDDSDMEISSTSSSLPQGSEVVLCPVTQEVTRREELSLMEALGDSITVAEESELLQKLDELILAAEEEELMERLLRDIEQAERREIQRKRPSCVERLEEIQDATVESWEDEPTCAMRENWEEVTFTSKDTTNSTGFRSGEAKGRLVENVERSSHIELSLAIPRFLAGAKKPFVTPHTFHFEFVESFKDRFLNDLRLDWLGFSVRASDIESDSSSLLVAVVGTKRIVNLFIQELKCWVLCRIMIHNLDTLLRDKSSYILHVDLENSSKWGIIVRELHRIRHNSLLMVEFADAHCELAKIIGRDAVAHGALIVEVNGTRCSSVDQWKCVVQDSRRNSKNMSVSLCVSRHANLSSLDRSRCTVKRLEKYAFFNNTNTAGARGEHAKIRTSNQKGDSLANSSKVGLSPQAYYNHFSEKFKDVIHIEYGRCGVYKKFASGKMWDVHKRDYGLKCDDSCWCCYDLESMTKGIVKSFVAQKSKKKKWNDPYDLRALGNKSPVGFVDNFAPNFLRLVVKEYPGIGPVMALKRVVDMWTFHTQSRYGFYCRKNCLCVNGWEGVFGKGDIERAQNRLNRNSNGSNKKRKLSATEPGMVSEGSGSSKSKENHGHGSSSTNARASGSHLLPRKSPNQKADGASSLISTQGKGEQSSVAKKRKSAAAGDQKESSSQQHYQPYEVTFDSASPLGFYCRTDPETKACKIVSVCPFGREKNDPRIQVGTCVQAVAIGSAKYPVKGYQDLRRYYTDARKRKSSLRLWLINSSVKATSMSMSAANLNDREWTKKGGWRGAYSDGWAGGSTVVFSPSQAIPKKGGKLTTQNSVSGQQQGSAKKENVVNTEAPQEVTGPKVHDRSTSKSPERNVASVADQVKKSSPSINQDWKVVNVMRPLQHRLAKPSKSLLVRSKHGTQKTRKVKFVRQFEERVFDKEGTSCEIIVKASAASTVPNNENIPLDPTTNSSSAVATVNDIVQAVRSGTYIDVIRLLKERAATDHLSLVSGLQNELDFVKHELDNIRSEEERTLKEKDLLLKQQVMKVYINAQYQITAARNLKKWCRYEIVVDRVSDVRLTKKGLARGIRAIWGKVSARQEELGPLPLRPISNTIQYEHPPTFHMNNNSGIIQDCRSLTIDLRHNMGADILGSATISLSEIDRNCPLDGKRGILRVNVTTGDFLEESAKVSLLLRRVDLKPDYLKRKRKEGADQVRVIINLIKSIDKEIVSPEHKLTGHICGEGNVSLLHAAIYFEDEAVVSELLSLGANVNAKSCIGSAMTLAVNMADRVAEKVKENEKSELVDEEQVIRRGQRTYFEDILKVLRQHTSGEVIGSSKTHNGTNESTSNHLRKTQHSGLTRETRGRGRGIEMTRPAWLKNSANVPGRLVVDDRKKLDTSALQSGGAFSPPWGSRSVVGATAELNETSVSTDNSISHLQQRRDGVDKNGHNVPVQKGFFSPQKGFFSPQRNQTDVMGSTSPSSHFSPTALRNENADKSATATTRASSVEKLQNREHDMVGTTQEHHQQGRGRGRGIEMTRPAWLTRTSDVPGRSFSNQSSSPVANGLDYSMKNNDGEMRHNKRRREDTPHTGREFAKKRAVSTQASAVDASLPVLRNAQWVPDGSLPACTFFARKSGCRRGRTCRYPHIQPPLGRALNHGPPPSRTSKEKVIETMTKYARVRSEKDSFGRLWYTAGCHDKSENIVYCAEGNGGRQSEQGIFWYSSAAQAQEALRHVISVVQFYSLPGVAYIPGR